MLKKRILIKNLIVFITLLIIIWILSENYEESIIKQKEENQLDKQNISNEITENDKKDENEGIIQETPEKEYIKEEIIAEYKGYEVAAKLQIPKINLDTYILQNYTVKALKVLPTKFWGANANQKGNFCVAGHNYRNKNMFYNLKELQIGDRLFISDSKIGKVEYEIYNIFLVDPKDTSCLSQETNGKREVTLITCTNDVKKRIIVKANEAEQ